jgi:hypothetical protein
MEIVFDGHKNCQAYKGFVENPEDRASQKKFKREFSLEIMTAAAKLHKKLLISRTASEYNNSVTGDNKIQLKSGVQDKEPVVLKVRVQGAYRKFFYFCENCADGKEVFGLTKNWCGQFDQILKIYVYEVNKHEYSKA